MSRRPSTATADVAARLEPRLLSIDQAAAKLGLSRNQVRDLVAYGHLPHVALPCPRAGDGRPMRRLLIDVADLDALIAATKVRELEP